MHRARSLFGTVAGLVGLAALALAAPATAATGDGSPSDSNIKFTGRWDTSNSAAYVPNWAGAYFTTGFTGTTVKLKQRNTIDIYYQIDGGSWNYIQNVSGTVNLTPTKLASGNHTLRISYRVVAGSYTGDAVFQGLVLDSGAKTLAGSVNSKLVEFVGDSITLGTTSSKNALTAYGWLVGEQLGVQHTQLGYGGGCLVASADGCASVAAQFLRTGYSASSPLWDFSRYQAGVVVVNLGTNDKSHSVSGTDFQNGYIAFLKTIRSKYPNATILALRTFIGRYSTETQAAVQSVYNGGDHKVQYVDTTGWLPSTGLSDSVHPNDSGHVAIAAKLAPLVQAAFSAGTTTTTTTTSRTTTTSSSTTSSTTSSSTSTTSSTTTTAGGGGSGACTATYEVTSSWPGGFVANVTVTAGSTALNGWKVTLGLPSGAALTGIWGGVNSGTSGTVTVTNAAYNPQVAAGQSTSFGFQGTGSGTGATVSCAAA